MDTDAVTPTSSVIFRWDYDVTLSYVEEEETTGKNNFIGNLYASLKKANFKTFKDIKHNLERGIKGSRCAVIIFSRNFASSTRCLEEVAFMMDCRIKFGQTVFPVFLMDVEGSDVRRQKGSFEEPFRKHELCFDQGVVQRWRSALQRAGELAGLNFKDIPDGNEEKLIARIVEDVSHVLSEIPPPNAVIEMQTEPIPENQPSTQRLLQKILDCIGDPEIDIIGLYGMGGVGKTTLAREVNDHFYKQLVRGIKMPFESVIMVVVSATPNVKSIQTDIGERLGFDLSKDSEHVARKKLFDGLRRKKFLLILDDVWSKLKISDVGIPHPQKHKGNKILVISRSEDACTDTGAMKTIKVKPLLEDEAWNLFVKVVGPHVVADVDIECFAEEIVERCEGLPLAIVTVARAMANRRTVGSWENAVREIKRSSSELRGMKEEVFVPLRFSFDRLENEMLKSLFLYCACFPEDCNIGNDDILIYCVGEGLVDKPGSLEAAKAKGEDLIESLKIACMLEEGVRKGSVKMHDMMRDLALWITSSTYPDSCSPKFWVSNNTSAEEAPLENEWVDVTRVSLLYTGIVELKELGETCRKLTSLRLWESWKIPIIIPQTNFFQHMKHLSILDLSFTGLQHLPNSVSCLENLRVLCLEECTHLTTLPPLGALRQLQVLNLFLCQMLFRKIFRPEDEGCETNLRYLNVECTGVCIRDGVFSRMQKLEDVRFYGVAGIDWGLVNVEDHDEGDGSASSGEGQREEEQEVEEISRPSDNSISNFADLLRLNHLRYLTIQFDCIIISDWFLSLVNKIRSLGLDDCQVEERALQAINQSQVLNTIYFHGCPGVTRVRMGKSSTSVVDCKDLEIVMDREMVDDGDRLKYDMFTLGDLPKLKRILVRPVSNFCHLYWIEIHGCNSLKMVFTKEMPRLFNSLSILDVKSCSQMRVIVEAAEEVEGKKVGQFVGVISPFPNLTKLKLENLPALNDLCSRSLILHCPLLTDLQVKECPMLNKDSSIILSADEILDMKGNKAKKRKSFHLHKGTTVTTQGESVQDKSQTEAVVRRSSRRVRPPAFLKDYNV